MSVIYTDVYHVQIQDAERFHPHKVFASLDPIVLYSFSPFSSLSITHLISVPIVLPFPDCHVKEIVHAGAFCVWLF